FRRTLDAGLSPWTGLLFFVPVVNYQWMLLLRLLPSHATSSAPAPAPAAAVPDLSPALRTIRAAAPAAAVGFAAMLVSVLLLQSYSAMLFVGAPVAVGFVAGFRAWREGIERRIAVTGVAQLALLLTAGTIVLFALEGVVCLVMVYPLAAALVE